MVWKQFLIGGHHGEVWFWHAINEIDSYGEGFRPKGCGDRCLMKESKAYFHNMTMTMFREAIMFGGMGWGGEIGNIILSQIVFKSTVSPLMSLYS